MGAGPTAGGAAAPGPLPAGRDRGELVAEVARALGGVPPDAGVLVAVSGGPDSTALAFLTAEARPDLRLVLGHVRHGLRRDDDDLAAVEAQAAFLGVELVVDQVVVARRGEGLEAAARTARYRALRRRARELGAAWVAVGHTADDQAETVLMRLVRGTGPAGAAAMAPVRDGLVRPLLRLRRGDVRRFVAEEGLPAVEDPMNRDPAFTRVVARQEVLPVLERLGADPVGALARFADLARIDAAALDRLAAAARERSVWSYGPAAAVATADLDALDEAVATRVLRGMVSAGRGGHAPPTAAQVAAIRSLGPGEALDLAALTVTCGGGWIAVAPRELPPTPPCPLAVPGRTPWPPTGIEVVATVDDGGAGASGPQPTLGLEGLWRPPPATVDPRLLPPGSDPAWGQLVAGPLPTDPVVRARRDGDRVVTAGGTRKLQDVLVDAGVPRALRDLLPVVAAGDRVLWVPGIVADAELAAAGRGTAAVHLAVAG